MEAERARLGITGPVAGGGPAENPLGPDVDLLPVGERFKWLWILFDFFSKTLSRASSRYSKNPAKREGFLGDCFNSNGVQPGSAERVIRSMLMSSCVG